MLYTRKSIDPQELKHDYQRIISLVPSQTELLYDLGLREEVAGITSFCIYPAEWYRSKTRIGGTKKVHFDRIDAIQPDLIIANKEENEESQILALAEKYPVWLTDVHDLPEAIDMISEIGTLVKREKEATELTLKIRKGFSSLEKRVPDSRPGVAYFIWQNPYMVAAANTFIDDMLQRTGFRNVFKRHTRYPVVGENELKTMKADYVFLSSEPYPFSQKHEPAFLELFPEAKIILVDGEMFSWYGSRLEKAPAYFKNLLSEMQKE